MTTPIIPTAPDGVSRFAFTWYHREEIQVLVVFLVLIGFFSRSIAVSAFLLGVVFIALGGLYAMRLLTSALHRQELFRNVILQYHQFRLQLGRESLQRSRVAMATLSSLVVGVLAAHRITLALRDPYYASPSDIYWILVLSWYFVVCSVITLYLLWIWGRTWEIPQMRSPLMDGLVASFFFYHGLSRRNRIVTFVAGFLLGGVPSFFATRLRPETTDGHQIAVLLIIPVVALSLGGAYYAMRCVNGRTS